MLSVRQASKQAYELKGNIYCNNNTDTKHAIQSAHRSCASDILDENGSPWSEQCTHSIQLHVIYFSSFDTSIYIVLSNIIYQLQAKADEQKKENIWIILLNCHRSLDENAHCFCKAPQKTRVHTWTWIMNNDL